MFLSKALIFAVLTVIVSAGTIPGEEAHSGQGAQKRSIRMNTGQLAKRITVGDCGPGQILGPNGCVKIFSTVGNRHPLGKQSS